MFPQLLSGMLNKTLSSRQKVKINVGFVWSLKCIDDELWCCHRGGITVYNFDLKKLRMITSNPDSDCIYSVESLDVNAVVIATDVGFSTCSTQGIAKLHFDDQSSNNVTSTLVKGIFEPAILDQSIC